MPAQRRFGMDHEHYDWSPISTRDVLRWPNDAQLALVAIVNLEHMEWSAPQRSYQPANLAGGSTARPFPDYARISHREYGHRVGIFRVLDVLQKYNIKPTLAVDALTAKHYPYLMDYCIKRDCEFVAHGISVSQMITSNMSVDEELEYIRESMSSIKRVTGTDPLGWFGPEYGESERTPQLLAKSNIRYVCDWANDEQPYPLKSPEGELTALPVMIELDDVIAMAHRRVNVDRYADMLTESFEVLYENGADNGRLMVLNLHPWLIGQPFRINYLDEALSMMMNKPRVWAATGSEITTWYQSRQKR
ncbi:MAG: polysaccharide deacetylase family protein [Chloroflexota bacterium]|nr:polysaccharide deacetylase family protein [Chloroflexota bacterium]